MNVCDQKAHTCMLPALPYTVMQAPCVTLTQLYMSNLQNSIFTFQILNKDCMVQLLLRLIQCLLCWGYICNMQSTKLQSLQF